MKWVREFPGALAALVCAISMTFAKDDKAVGISDSTTNAPGIELTGKVIKQRATTNAPVFRADSGAVYSLVRNQKSEALFTDTNLLARTLIIKGRVRPTNTFEITGNLHSLREGKRYEVYYYCDVCAIKSSEPGPCMCCREPVRLVEEPE